jgi:hypothetical protein
LWEALEEYGAAQGTLIVQEGAPQVLERDGRSVQVVPAWQWLMGEGA